MRMVRKFRLIRLRHRISCAELAKAAGVSPQRISQLELDLTYCSRKTEALLEEAFGEIVRCRARELELLRADFERSRSSLMDPVEEVNDEQ